MLKPTLDEAYQDELLVLLPVTLLVNPLAQLFILQKFLTNNNTSARG